MNIYIFHPQVRHHRNIHYFLSLSLPVSLFSLFSPILDSPSSLSFLSFLPLFPYSLLCLSRPSLSFSPFFVFKSELSLRPGHSNWQTPSRFSLSFSPSLLLVSSRHYSFLGQGTPTENSRTPCPNPLSPDYLALNAEDFHVQIQPKTLAFPHPARKHPSIRALEPQLVSCSQP